MVKWPEMAAGSEIDQKQLERSSLVKRIGVPDRGSERSSRRGREKEGGFPYRT